ncbi:MAG: hypothetical protein U0Q19_00400 [Kineosporiaceae bacterium]
MSTEKQPSPQYLAFAEEFLQARPDVDAGSMFGMRCLKRAGKAFAGGFAGGLVVKLDAETLADAATLAHSRAFDPSGAGRPMKAWIVLGTEHQDRWPEFAVAAYAAASSA